MQKPDSPLDVYLVTQSQASIKVLWKYPESNGGDEITKYLIERMIPYKFDFTIFFFLFDSIYQYCLSS